MLSKKFIFPSLLLFVVLLGCSSKSPLEPGFNTGSDPSGGSFDMFVAEHDELNSSVTNGILGIFDIHVDSTNLTAEIVPRRFSSKEGDSFLISLNFYFTAVPCKDCLTIDSVSVNSDNDIVLKLQTKHPFDTADTAQPPSSKNRDDLRIFDVKLILVAEGDTEFNKTGLVLNPGIVPNADGYTHIEDLILDETNDIETNAYPYIILAEDPTSGNVDPTSATGFTDIVNASGHNVLNQGSTYYDDLVIHLPYGQILDASLVMFGEYGQSSFDWKDRLTPQYWLPEFNIKEPWKMEVEIGTNGLNDATASSSATVNVKVWDWQHSAATIDPNLIELDSIKASSEISQVSVEIPGVTHVNDTATAPVSGNGLNTTPLLYNVEVNNDKLASAGNYVGIVKATDSRNQGENYGSLGELVEFDPASGLEFNKVYEFASYQVFNIEVASAGGSDCGPMNVTMQYGEAGGMGFLIPLVGNTLHFLDGSEMKIKAAASVPGGLITNYDFDFDDPAFDDQSGTEHTVTQIYNNPNCGGSNEPLELQLTVTVTDDCDATLDWQDVFTVFVYCGDPCGPIISGDFKYGINGGDLEDWPLGGITIQHNDEVEFRASGYTSLDSSIDNYYFDFDDPRIEDQSRNTSSVTRIIPHPNCVVEGAETYLLLLDFTVTDTCPVSSDLYRQYKIYVECSTDCGPISGGHFEYSLDGTFFTELTSNSLTIMNAAEVTIKAFDFASPNANITTYSFEFDDPVYDDQTGASESVMRVYDNTNCVAGYGDPQYIGLTCTISDDCEASVDYVENFILQIICAPCNGTGLSFTQPYRVIASQTSYNNLDITKSGGGGMKIADGGNGFLYAGFKGVRNSDSKPGIGIRASTDGGSNWLPVTQFIPTTVLPGGFAVTTDDAAIVVIAWFDPSTDTIYVERSENSGVVFERTEIHSASNNITSISIAQDPIDPTMIYILFTQDNDSSSTSNSIKLLKSTDTGETFPISSLKTVYSSNDVYNRYFTTADIVASPYFGYLYIAAAQNDNTGSNVFITRSTNMGADFDSAKVFSNAYGESIDSLDIIATDSAHGGQAVYCAFAQGDDSSGLVKLIKGKISLNSFGVIHSAINDDDGARPYEAGIATDRLGYIYVVWHDNREHNDFSDVFADYSRDAGITFGEDKIVNESATGTAHRTSAEVVIHELNCDIIVVYEDDSASPNGEIFSRIG